MRRFDVVALDADDTLWHNETLFAEATSQYHALLAGYHDGRDGIAKRLHETEMRNLSHFGYGVKGFTLSMIETAIELSEGRVTGAEIQRIVDLGREMLRAPVELLDGVADAVAALSDYRLALVTKGDLFDQEGKLARSGLGEKFAAVEVVSEKDAATYARVMKRLDVEPARFVMVGNSLKSDVLPVLEAGGAAVHVPYHLTWQHERVPDEALLGKDFARLASIRELPDYLALGGRR